MPINVTAFAIIEQMARLPVPGADKNVWGEVLNDYLRTSLGDDGKLKDDAVTTGKVLDGAITSAKLDSGVQAAITAAASAVGEVDLDKQWIITGPINVAAGDVDYIAPAFITVPSGYTAVITTVRGRINSGTNATLRVAKNGVTLTGLSTVVVTTSGVSVTGLSLAVADGDLLVPIVTSTSGSPQNMTLMVTYKLTKV